MIHCNEMLNCENLKTVKMKDKSNVVALPKKFNKLIGLLDLIGFIWSPNQLFTC